MFLPSGALTFLFLRTGFPRRRVLICARAGRVVLSLLRYSATVA